MRMDVRVICVRIPRPDVDCGSLFRQSPGDELSDESWSTLRAHPPTLSRCNCQCRCVCHWRGGYDLDSVEERSDVDSDLHCQ